MRFLSPISRGTSTIRGTDNLGPDAQAKESKLGIIGIHVLVPSKDCSQRFAPK